MTLLILHIAVINSLYAIIINNLFFSVFQLSFIPTFFLFITFFIDYIYIYFQTSAFFLLAILRMRQSILYTYIYFIQFERKWKSTSLSVRVIFEKEFPSLYMRTNTQALGTSTPHYIFGAVTIKALRQEYRIHFCRLFISNSYFFGYIFIDKLTLMKSYSILFMNINK